MKFFYQSSTMSNLGQGYSWHKFFKFSKFETVTKTVTINKKVGTPYRILVDPLITKSTWNQVQLHNKGFIWLYKKLEWYKLNGIETNHLVVSLAGTDSEINHMISYLNYLSYENLINIKGLELNFSCPNIKDPQNNLIPVSDLSLYLKLRWNQDPNDYNLSRVKGVRLNSVPKYGGGVSGKLAQKRNWQFVKDHLEDLEKNGVTLSGSSWVSTDDLKRLEQLGVKECGVGSVMLINPWLVESL